MCRFSVTTQKEQKAETLVKHSDLWWKPSLLEIFLQARLDKPEVSIICPHAADGTDRLHTDDNKITWIQPQTKWAAGDSNMNNVSTVGAGIKQKRKSRDSGRQMRE